MSGKPVDPQLAAQLEQAVRALRQDLAKGLEQGARAWAEQSNQALKAVSARIEKLEQRSSANRKR